MAKPRRGNRRSQSARAPQSAAQPEGRILAFTPNFIEDLRWWVETNPRTAARILELIMAVQRDPFHGIGKPEPLRYLAADTWSRRISEEHRLVYRVSDQRIDFLQARYHY